MSKGEINLVQLYPRDMNIYGDWGNTLVLIKRLERHGYDVNLINYNQGDAFPDNADLIVGGGGQDSGQQKIEADLMKIGPNLKQLAEKGTPMLLVCGLYQQFGHRFITREGKVIEGLGILDVETIGGEERLIGNIISESDNFGEIIGYENHSGLTTLGPNAKPFGRVIRGAGNNNQDGTEGAVYKNIIGTYLHGSVLPKNPLVADWLIERAVRNKFGSFLAEHIDDSLTDKAREHAAKRPR